MPAGARARLGPVDTDLVGRRRRRCEAGYHACDSVSAMTWATFCLGGRLTDRIVLLGAELPRPDGPCLMRMAASLGERRQVGAAEAVNIGS
jgi:hypothetical protein